MHVTTKQLSNGYGATLYPTEVSPNHEIRHLALLQLPLFYKMAEVTNWCTLDAITESKIICKSL